MFCYSQFPHGCGVPRWAPWVERPEGLHQVGVIVLEKLSHVGSPNFSAGAAVQQIREVQGEGADPGELKVDQVDSLREPEELEGKARRPVWSITRFRR